MKEPAQHACSNKSWLDRTTQVVTILTFLGLGPITYSKCSIPEADLSRQSSGTSADWSAPTSHREAFSDEKKDDFTYVVDEDASAMR